MPATENQATGDEQLKEFEDNFPPLVLEISKSRRKAQDDLMAIAGSENTGPITRAQAHERLMNPTTSAEKELSLSSGYNIIFSGLGFSGYAVGPLLVGGLRGQQLAQARGSYDLSTGLLISDTLECATLYCSHICSYVEYNLGLVVLKVTDPGSPNAIIEEVPYQPKS